ncbi:MAG: hypothetical protein M3Y65_00680 [Pseudomonadota bacterium]|nr:hypothetical protein [Pseudomonadota bacterium]
MKLYLPKAILLSMGALLLQAASAEPVDNAAAQKAQQIRLEVAAKQKALAQEQRNDTAAPVAAPVAPLDLPIDATDSPGATK